MHAAQPLVIETISQDGYGLAFFYYLKNLLKKSFLLLFIYYLKNVFFLIISRNLHFVSNQKKKKIIKNFGSLPQNDQNSQVYSESIHKHIYDSWDFCFVFFSLGHFKKAKNEKEMRSGCSLGDIWHISDRLGTYYRYDSDLPGPLKYKLGSCGCM